MLRPAVLALLCLALAAAQSRMEKKIARNIRRWNDDVVCWGRENSLKYHVALAGAVEECAAWGRGGAARLASQTSRSSPWKAAQALPAGLNRGNLAALWSEFIGNNRQKRQATEGLLDTDEGDVEEFLEDFKEYKTDLGQKMGNLTCVLTKMEMLDSDLQVNLASYTTGLWDQVDLSETLAGEDPQWRAMLEKGFQDCYSVAQTWPQEALDRNPVSKVFGRHMIFFKCARKVERKCCYEAELYDWIKTLYGEDPTFNWSQFGLPNNKYELAAVTMQVLGEAASDSEEFVGDFFYADPAQDL